MKIGIVSQFNNENLGNKLQNYALQQVLLDYAHEVITVINKPAAKNGVDYVKRFLLAESLLLNKLLGKTRKVNFLEFHKRHIRSSRYVYCINKDYQSLKKADRCALYCAGSDQVWKPGSGLAGKIQYLPFTDRERTFSYAASFGVDTVAEKYRQQVKTGLEHINHISVREDAGIGIIEDLTGRRDARVLVDPTMLLRADQWDQVAVKPKADLFPGNGFRPSQGSHQCQGKGAGLSGHQSDGPQRSIPSGRPGRLPVPGQTCGLRMYRFFPRKCVYLPVRSPAGDHGPGGRSRKYEQPAGNAG